MIYKNKLRKCLKCGSRRMKHRIGSKRYYCRDCGSVFFFSNSVIYRKPHHNSKKIEEVKVEGK